MKEPIDAVGPVLLASLVIGSAGGLYLQSVPFFRTVIYAGCAIGACCLLWQQYRWGWV